MGYNILLNQSTSSHLPIDIIIEILLGLPVKTLCRFRLVSKSWRALISDPNFQKSHHHRSKQKPLLLLLSQQTICSNCIRHEQYRLASIKHEGEADLIGENLGVSCFSKWRRVSTQPSCLRPYQRTKQNYGRSIVFHSLKQWQVVPTCLDLACIYDARAVYICNPTTRDIFTLPRKTSQHDGCYNHKMVAFGYDSSTMEYKVLRLFYKFLPGMHIPRPVLRGSKWGSELISIKIHDGKISCDDCWREVGDFPFSDCKGDSVLINSYIHVMPHDSSNVGMAQFHYYSTVGIARFDLEQDEWSVIQAPWQIYDFTWMEGDEIFIRELNEKLCVVHSTCSSAQERLDLWLLENYEQGEWVKQYSIDVSSLHNDPDVPVIPLLMDEAGRILMKVGKCKLACYDPRTDETQLIREEKKPFTPGFYVESFISLK